MTGRNQYSFSEQDLEIARTDPGQLYGAEYYGEGYEKGTSHKYGRHDPWLTFFKGIARRINRNFRPKTVADVGCAYGLLVEALVDKGVDAYGFDVSSYAIGNSRPDIQNRLTVHSLFDPIPLRDGKKYDLAVCIEVLEHIPPESAELAIKNLCACSDRILFSSSPDDFDEPTHFNVLPTDAWLKMFAKHGFLPAKRGYMATYVAQQARVVENAAAKPATFWASLSLGRF